MIRDNHVHTVRDVGIGLESAPGAQVINNRIITENYPNSIEYRFAATTDVVITGNQVTGNIISHDGGRAEVNK